MSQATADQQVHDSAACQQQLESVHREMLGEVSGNPQLAIDQHVLSQLCKVHGSTAQTTANSVAGIAHGSA